jgi:two-component system chemotaxis sensor kinase CheA
VDDLIQEFLVESSENLDRYDSELVKLETTPSAAGSAREIPLLRRSRSRQWRPASAGCGPGGAKAPAASPVPAASPEQPPATVPAAKKEKHSGGGTKREKPAAAAPAVEPYVDPLSREEQNLTTQRAQSRAAESAEQSRRLESKPEPQPPAASPDPVPAKSPAAATKSEEEAAAAARNADSTIRVNVTLLDRLMNLVGELVLSRNQLMQFAGQQEDTAFAGTLQRLNLVTSELRESVMKTRMQPISRLFDKVPRVVRDVSMTCGKQVRLETEGKETELDRTLLEAMNDPLTHLVRNAIDHGVESPEKRVAAGKPAEGLLRLRALHEGGQVTIEITDVGAGIDVERIRRKAVERGMVSAETAARMGTQEALNLILLPGVSTAEKVTNVSGRGVGMDVVKTNIERVGGSIEIQTQLGQGTTFKVKLPLTLAIVPALIVRSTGKRFAIPQVNLVELVRAELDKGGVELVHDVPVHRLRGRLLPLLYLNRELGIADRAGERLRAVNIVVLQVDSRQFGLVVDEVHDTEEIVVKPLSKHLKAIKAYAGATIMGDGKPVLILDVPGLAQSARLTAGEKASAAVGEAGGAQERATDKQQLVLFSGPGGSRMAVPLGVLARLEEFAGASVERSGNQWVTQYRGQILPLIRISEVLEERRVELQESLHAAFPPAGPIPVLVLNHGGRMFGLVVDRILDIVEDIAAVQTAATRAGVLYSAVIGERVTEMLDVPAILVAGERAEIVHHFSAEAGQ